MKKVAFVCDSGSGIDAKKAESLGIEFLPLQYTCNNESILEGIEINIEELYDRMEAGEEISTSLSPVGKITELFEKLKNDGYDEVFCFPITTGLSSNAPTMEMVAKQVGIEFDYIDCYAPAVIQIYSAVLAKKWYEEGISLDIIKEKIKLMVRSSSTLIVPENMDQLAKSGRLTPLAAKLAGLLKIKPILYLNERTLGKVEVYDKVRTSKKAFSRMVDKVSEDVFGDGEGYFIVIEDVRNQVDGEYVFNLLKEKFPKAQFYRSNLVGVVSAHTGLGCVGIQYFKIAK